MISRSYFSKHQQIFLLLFVLSAVHLSPLISMGVHLCDEGLVLVGAERIQKGDLPFNDFYTIYPPGQYYVLASLFDVFGSSIFVERIYDIVVKSLISLLIFSIIRKIVHFHKLALIGWGLSLIWLSAAGFPSYPVYPAILLIYISVYYFLCYLESGKYRPLAICAVFVSLCALFRHDLAAYSAISIFIVLIAWCFNRKRENLSAVYCYVSAGVATAALFVGFILLKNIEFKSVVNQLIFIPADFIPKYRWLPYPQFSLINSPFYIFPFILLLSFVVSLFRIKKYQKHDKLSYGLLAISILGFFFSNQVRVRSDLPHLLPVALNSLILVPILWFVLSKSVPSKFRWLITALFVVTVCLGFRKPINREIVRLKKGYFIKFQKSPIPRAGYAHTSKDLKKVIAYLHDSTSKMDSIFVGASNHDHYVNNDIAIYYLAGREYATKYHQFDPGVTNTLTAQREIVEELTNSSTKKIILSPQHRNEPNESSIDLKLDIIDDFIRMNYKIDVNFGKYQVWSKKLTHEKRDLPKVNRQSFDEQLVRN